jgi:tether containing UBX domain for GLUT4
MSVIVEFESFPVKKCTIKTTPAMSIQSITSQACTTLKLDPPEAYQLQLKKQILQPSLSFRLSGIPSGSKLQLIYRGVSLKPQKVTIALQTEESGRVIDVFDPSDTLWQMLLHFETKCSVNLTRKTGIPPKKSIFQASTPVYIMPVCVFMNKEVKLF